MERTRAESLLFVVASSLIALGTLFAVTWVAGFDQVAARLRDVDPVWFATAFGAELVAYVGYIFAYREVARIEPGCELPTRDLVAAVAAGFGSFVARGGFAVDVHAFKQAARSSTRSLRRRRASSRSSCWPTAIPPRSGSRFRGRSRCHSVSSPRSGRSRSARRFACIRGGGGTSRRRSTRSTC